MFVRTLPTNARRLLKQLGQGSLAKSFYLAGGSAAALHLGHRVSIDLDFFTPRDDYEAEPLTQQLRAIGHLNIQQQGRGTLIGLLKGVRISFFSYPYPLLAETAELDRIAIAHLLDIALMKLIAISQRGTKRDFIDLYFICQHGYRLDDLLRRVPEKYQTVSYSSYHLLRALAYFADADADETPQMLVSFDWNDVKKFFEGEARRLAQQL
ncbi:MAG: nucleotidyl transferase AbiEii/AbiGii toxin family protein [Anaerolineae bacterium]